jgi:predicted acylesterase/phospholipase RssA
LDTSGKPTVDKGLVGLALSGGGIRSATFGLGVIQALIEKGKFKFIDYISTVSGGGYIGSCVSSVLNAPGADEACFENVHGSADPPAVKHLRNSSNYLSPGGLFDKLRIPTILLRGILLNLFLIIPTLILAVFLTEILNELWHEAGTYTLSPFIIVIPFIILTYLFAFIRRTFRRRFDWNKRNAYELILSKLFALSIFVLCLIPVFWIVRYCVNGWWGGSIISFFHITSLKGGLYKTFFVIGGLIVFFFLVNKIREGSRIPLIILRYVIGVLGPLFIFSVYLLFCIFFIESPYFDEDYALHLNRLGGGTWNVCQKEKCQPELRRVLKGKDYKLSTEDTQVKITSIKINSEDLHEMVAAWKITYKNIDGEKKSLEVQQKKGYLFIPGLSIFQTLKDPEKLIFGDLSGFARRIHWKFYLFGILLFFFNLFILDVNITSSHGFYRDRLSRAYLFQQNSEGFIFSNDDQKMSELNRDDSVAPYHLINTSLNLPGSNDPNLRGRNADFFTISKCYAGSKHTGYCRTEDIETLDPHFSLGTAMAISAAAAAPNMGAMTMKQFVFIMTLLNVRLGYWAPNPSKINRTRKLSRWRWPGVGPRYLLKEAVGNLNAKKSYVNLSDGGHIENLAIYQLLKRRCKLIIAVDAEADANFVFNGLVTLIRFADIDMGITIDIDLDGIRNRIKGLSTSHWVLGKIKYDREETGHLLYIKSSLTGDENEFIKAYNHKDPSFPDQTTADQFFDETQFECYRALGEHIASGALDDAGVKEVLPG